jgi:hypothetical protein
VDKFRQLWKTLGVGIVLDAPVSFDCFAFTPPARLPREVPEKAEAFSYQNSMRDTTSCCTFFVAMMTLQAAPDQKKLRFFRPITWRVGLGKGLIIIYFSYDIDIVFRKVYALHFFN